MWAFCIRSITEVFHIYIRIYRGMELGPRAVVHSSNGEFLLVRQTYMSGWHLPGGSNVGQTAE